MHATIPLLQATGFPPLMRQRLTTLRVKLQSGCKRELFEYFGIVFIDLTAFASMPIRRLGSILISKGRINVYLALQGATWPDHVFAARPHLRSWPDEDPAGRPVRVAEHCYGRTAGQGRSCGGAMTDESGFA